MLPQVCGRARVTWDPDSRYSRWQRYRHSKLTERHRTVARVLDFLLPAYDKLTQFDNAVCQLHASVTSEATDVAAMTEVRKHAAAPSVLVCTHHSRGVFIQLVTTVQAQANRLIDEHR